MPRLHHSVGVILLTAILSIGTSTGPAFADEAEPPPPTAATVEPAGPPVTSAPVTVTPSSQPAAEPTATSDPSKPAQPSSSVQPSTTAEPSEPELTPPKPASPQQSAPEPTPAAEEEMADLQLTAWFDKPAYLGHERITAHARVTNVGTAPMNHATLTSTGNLSWHSWTSFDPLGIRIEPGQNVEGSATGEPTTAEGVVRLVITVQARDGQEDANPADNTVTVTVPITFVRGSLRGTVYGDHDGSNTMDHSNALSNRRPHRRPPAAARNCRRRTPAWPGPVPTCSGLLSADWSPSRQARG